MVPSEPVITPAVNFMVLNDTVSLCEAMYCNVLLVHTQIMAYPGEPVHLVIEPYDEQNFIGSDMFEIQGTAVESVSIYRHIIIETLL